MARKIIGITAENQRIFAVCDDGTLWSQAPAVGGWTEVLGPADAEPPPGDAVVEGADVDAPAENDHPSRKKGSHHGR